MCNCPAPPKMIHCEWPVPDLPPLGAWVLASRTSSPTERFLSACHVRREGVQTSVPGPSLRRARPPDSRRCSRVSSPLPVPCNPASQVSRSYPSSTVPQFAYTDMKGFLWLGSAMLAAVSFAQAQSQKTTAILLTFPTCAVCRSRAAETRPGQCE